MISLRSEGTLDRATVGIGATASVRLPRRFGRQGYPNRAAENHVAWLNANRDSRSMGFALIGGMQAHEPEI